MGRLIYDQNFKKTLVELLNSGKPVKELTKEFGVSQASIHRWGNSENTIASFSYNLVNDVFQVVQAFDGNLIPSGGKNPMTGNRSNLNIDGTPNYKPVNGFVNTLTTLKAIARGVNLFKSTVPKGIGYLRKINASQFSKIFKGNLARLKPIIRGRINRIINMGISSYNNQISNGLILLKSMMLRREEE